MGSGDTLFCDSLGLNILEGNAIILWEGVWQGSLANFLPSDTFIPRILNYFSQARFFSF